MLPAWQSLAELDELTHNWGALTAVLRSVIELDPSNTAVRQKLARLLLLQGALDDALRLVNDSLETGGPNAELLALKAAVLFKIKDTDGSVREAQAALKIDPANVSAMLVLAGNDLASGDAKAALAILNSEALAQSSDLGISLFKLQVLEKIKDFPEAEKLLRRLIELYPDQITFKRGLISLYLAQNRNDDAEREQRLLVAADPKNVEAKLGLVRLLNTTKGPEAAKQQLLELIGAGGEVFPYQIALAQLDFAQRRFPESAALLKKLISDASSKDHVLTARVLLAEMYLNQKQVDAAEALVSEILSSDSGNTSGLKLRAEIRMDRGQVNEAINDLRQALSEQPRAVDLMLLLSVAYERSGSIDLAEKEFADAMRVSNFNPTVSLNYASFLQRRGNIARAEDLLGDLAARWPNNNDVLSALAQVRLARQEWAGAQEVAETIKRIGPNRAVADELLGAALAGQSKYNESISAFKDAYASAPTAAQPMYALVRTYLGAGKKDEAIAFLQSVLKASPDNAEAYVLLGSVQLGNKALDQAQQSFMKAIEKQPTKAVGYRALADFYLLQNNPDEALKTIRAGLKNQPDNPVLRVALADLLQRKGDVEAAISEYERLLIQEPSSLAIANNLASLLAEYRTDKPSLDRALAIAASLKKSPVAQFKDTQGWVSYRLGDLKTALPLLEEAAAALPKDALVHYHLGMGYLAAAQSEKASDQLKLALQQAPNHELETKIRAAQSKISTQ